MNAKYFLDTNIFVYSFDDSQPEKKDRALTLIAEGLTSGFAIISTQVIQEFLNVATRKFANPLDVKDSKVYLNTVLNPLCEIFPDKALYEQCLELQHETGYSFYDSLILSAALRGACEVLFSEDLHDGQQIGNLTIVNPFLGDE